jgi:hypothetical protein
MKIRLKVLAVVTDGDQLAVTLQEQEQEQDAMTWRPAQRAVIHVHDTLPNQRAYRVGRLVEIDMVPR